ncbi:hypothetical protein RFI_13091 [Reticulomyxa filosa]|uniref:Isopenicillin N synthase-like Fe(2+) 2OG dioxygenase domain-containing protein n=1 Tax=Reticulomyxa filosa TaxID=46433 RepID=X6NFE8_RETFI|nr:hypothetical protein RFI_13091 [Reticulomyxa filosa]|eukprot:ETO24067.1 hypothetical protein RFI_13091 [Reticulomyxa filosa]
MNTNLKKKKKWRYFWKVQKKKSEEKTEEFRTLNAENISPQGIPEWKEVCEDWGACMLGAAKTISEGVAIGLKLNRSYFTDLLENGPHLLAPTGIDFNKYGKLNTIIAGYHYDLNFITLHGKSRFPGLYIWLRDGRRCAVKVPEGCLIAQAAKQLEWITGGFVYMILYTLDFFGDGSEARKGGALHFNDEN